MKDNNVIYDNEELDEESEGPEQEMCRHHHGPHGPHGPHGHGPHGPHGKPEIPPHILKEMMDMKEKIGKLEGMIEVLMKKL